MLRLSALTALAAIAVVACSGSAAPSSSEPSPGTSTVAAPASKAPVAESGATPAERLALAAPGGTTGADKAVEATQADVLANKAKDDAWIMLGRAWIRKARESADPGFYLNANACADVVLARTPDSRLATDLRGLVLLNDHKFDEARTLASEIVAKHPDDPMAWGTLSDAYLEMGRYDEATRAAQQMVDLKPNLPSYSRASHLQWLRGDVAGAKETVRVALDSGRAAKSDPEPGAWVLVQAAMIFWHEGDYEGAEAGCDKALERISDYAPANVCKGRVAMVRGDHRRAAELFARAFKVSPLAETAWLLGDARQAMGDAKGAAEAYAEVEREGRRSDPRTLSLFLSTKADRPADAEDALRLARAEHERRKDIYTEDALAWALLRTGRIEEAKAAITRARRLGTPDARLLYHEGAIRIAAGEGARGDKLVREALARNPAFDVTASREAKALLEGRAAPTR